MLATISQRFTSLDKTLTCAVAEDIGVCAEPEVEVQQLTSEHPFMVIASDGVFEFLTNQEVINMVSPLSLQTCQVYDTSPMCQAFKLSIC